VSGLLRSSTERKRLGEAGRALYEQQLNWEAAWARLRKAGI